MLTHLLAIETVTKIVGLQQKDKKWRSYRYILLHARTHIMKINQHNSVLHAFSVPVWSEMCESSTYWQFFYYHPPSKFRYTAGKIVKMWCQELDIYGSIMDMDLLYQFNLRLHQFSQFFFSMLKQMVFKIFKSWQVYDWLAKWLLVIITIMMGFMDLRRPMVAPRPNVRLVSSMSKISFEGRKQNLRKIPCSFKTWVGFVGQILIMLETSSIWGFR